MGRDWASEAWRGGIDFLGEKSRREGVAGCWGAVDRPRPRRGSLLPLGGGLGFGEGRTSLQREGAGEGIGLDVEAL